MLWAAVAFFGVWGTGHLILKFMDASGNFDILAMHVLMAAYFAHLLARTVHLSILYRNVVVIQPFVQKR